MSNKLRNAIISELKKQLIPAIRKATVSVQPKIEQLMAVKYNQEEFVSSLRGDLLKADFGLTDATSDAAISGIINWLIDNLKFSYVVGSGETLATWTLTIQLGVPPNDILGGNYKSNRYDISWLDWLLTKGTQVVVGDYAVVYGNFVNSRSGLAKMERDYAAGFRVHPKFAGTTNDNVITRYIAKHLTEISDLMVKEVLYHWA